MSNRTNRQVLAGIDTLLKLTKFGPLDDHQLATLNALLDEAEARGL